MAGAACATVLALGAASVSAAFFKMSSGVEVPIYMFQQRMAPFIIGVGSTGFVVGVAVMAWMFYFDKSGRQGPDEADLDDRSKV